jgi:hypothetical protein
MSPFEARQGRHESRIRGWGRVARHSSGIRNLLLQFPGSLRSLAVGYELETSLLNADNAALPDRYRFGLQMVCQQSEPF